MSVGKNIAHDSARSHVTGESIFVDDRPRLKNEVLVGVVGAPVSAGLVKAIDLEEAKKVEGVLGIYTGADFHHNLWGTIVEEQPILAHLKIAYIDEPMVLIAAMDEAVIAKAKSKIKFDIEEHKAILTIDEAIAAKSILYEGPIFSRGQVDSAISNAPHKLSGEFIIGGQEHFYMESQATIAYPMENGQIEVHSSSQHPSETQHVVAHSLGLNFSEVVCIVKRMGGGFGGKESQAAQFAAMAALVAQKLKRPARLALTKDDDMMMTGKRHPFKNFYEIGFDNDGRILGFKAKLYANAGAYTDLTPSILERAMFHIDGCYYFPHCHIEGFALRTNQHSNTAFRGFGGPQGNATIESVLEDVALYLKKDSFLIRHINLYAKTERNVTPYNQLVDNNVLPELFEKLHLASEYRVLRQEVDQFNAEKSGKVRGLSMTGCKFGIAFTARFLNQGNALVNVHLDGTIQVSTGATEMGQGVNTKIAQVAASAFGIDVKNVKVMATSTEKNHNTSPTAASSGADINCAATLLACEKIMNRLRWIAHLHFSGVSFNDSQEYAPYVEGAVRIDHIKFESDHLVNSKSNQKVALIEIIKKAYLNRVSLGDYAHFKTEGLGFNKKTITGKAFNYFTNGAAVSMVEIDEYTGEMKILRTDILMDLGRPINPGIDVGQVSGAFTQGMGWVTTEQLSYGEGGKLLTHSPTTYKIPNIQDTPRVFNIHLLENHTNTQNVLRSKAVGEPPLLLGTSVWTAIKNALSYRVKTGLPKLVSPATNEAILMELHRYE